MSPEARASRKTPPVHEVQGARVHPGAHHGREHEQDRGAHQDAQVGPARPDGLRFRGLVGDEGVGRQREGLVAHEEGEHIRREGDGHDARDRHGEADEKPRLMLLLVPPHVADGVDGVQDPQARGDERVDHPEGLHVEGDGDAGEHLQHGHRRGRALERRRDEPDDAGQEREGRHHGDALPEVGLRAHQGDKQPSHQGDRDGQRGRGLDQGAPPSSTFAAYSASRPVSSASTPRITEAEARIHMAISIVKGASRTRTLGSGSLK